MKENEMLDDVVLGFVKPDAAPRVGAVLARIESVRFSIEWLHTVQLHEHTARALYAEHAERAFFESLIDFTLSGLVTVFILRDRYRDKYPEIRQSAQTRFRSLLGNADAMKAAEHTLRHEFGTGTGPRNAIHATAETSLIRREAMILDVWEYVVAIAERK